MTLAEAVAKFEGGFTVSKHIGFPHTAPVNRRDWSRCPAGVPYVAITHCGVKPEGAPFWMLCRTEEQAVEAWLRAAQDYARPFQLAGEPMLFWRHKPEVSVEDGGFVVYSRLAIIPVGAVVAMAA